MITVLVANPKGGCGKTTLATHLAAAFANGGLRAALADTDVQHSSLAWLDERPKSAATITGLDWVKKVKTPPADIDRLVIDSAASIDREKLRDLVRAADLVVVPVLASAFDMRATLTFIQTLSDLKPIRKHKKTFALIRNRVRLGSRAVKRLDSLMFDTYTKDLGWLTDRSLYNEVAWEGLTVFDLDNKRAREIQNDWIPLVRFVEDGTTAL